MFINFFYTLKEAGIPVSPTSFLTLHKALDSGLINSLNDVYTCSRTILVKSERYFDLFDQVFAHCFEGAEMPDPDAIELDEMTMALLDEWLQDPQILADALGIDESEISKLTPEELLEYFKERLKEQTGRHAGGNKWIGTGGTSPVGHSGYHPGGMRVGGVSRNKSAIKVALERRYKDYSLSGPLTQGMVGEALKRLRHMVPAGPKDQIDIDETIYQTMKNGGEIDIVFTRSLKDRLKIILLIDNGGWSMDPYIAVVQTIFDYARTQFKEVKTFFFHNTIYGTVWEDPSRIRKSKKVEEFARIDPETRLIFIGDASMAPYELMATDGSIYVTERSGKSSVGHLKFLAENFPHSAWLNPVPQSMWGYTQTISVIYGIFPMFELTINGLEKTIAHLMMK
ncbi:MAG: VWA domain-containing protein [Deltaproteobacteria bacterium]|nr:VWA domain-containing protein [Deltaproteobacteria bacterium]